ncbi:hypothetical protein BC628DRAFT_1414170 [Trametes gibbosa]|nr:hypothetical protein BC628DRAFT_1414170 [Trametes gibbosa]
MSDGGTQPNSGNVFGRAPSTTPLAPAESTLRPHLQSTPADSVAVNTGSSTPGVEQANLISMGVSQSSPHTTHGAYLYAPGMQSSKLGASAQTNGTGMDLLSGMWLPSNFNGLGTPHRAGVGWPTGYTPDGRYGNLAAASMMMPVTPFNPYSPVRAASGHTNISEMNVGPNMQTDPFTGNLGVMGQMRRMYTFPPGDTSFEPGLHATSTPTGAPSVITKAITGGPVSNPADRTAPEDPDNTRLTGLSGPSHPDDTGTPSTWVEEPQVMPLAAVPMNFVAGSGASVDNSVEDHIKEVVQAEVGRVFAGPARRMGGPTPPVMRHAVHDAMRTLMGVREKYAVAPGCKKSYMLPHPLEEGDDVRHAGDGARLYNPDWYGNVQTPVNHDYINATVGLVQQNAKAYHLPPAMAQNDTMIHLIAVGYFKNLKRKYLSINDLEAMENEAKRSTKTITHLRKHRKTDNLRVGFDPFILLFGRERTLGIEAVVCSPCQSEEESTPKGVTPSAARERCRKKAGVSENAYQVLKLNWRSPKLTRTHIVLAVLSRYTREHEDISDLNMAVIALKEKAALADPTGPGAAECLEQGRLLCKQYLERVEKAVKGWSTIYDNPQLRYQRFVGPSQNWLNFPPTNLRSKVIYKECVSSVWAEKSAKNAHLLAKMPACPAKFTIFDLDLPDSLIPSDDLAALKVLEAGGEVDDEDSDGEEADKEMASQEAGGHTSNNEM